MQILIVKKIDQQYETIGIYSFKYPEEIWYFMQGTLSPDYRKIILQPSGIYCSKFFAEDFVYHKPHMVHIYMYENSYHSNHIELFPNKMQILSKQTHAFAFDPRYPWQRTAVGYNLKISSGFVILKRRKY